MAHQATPFGQASSGNMPSKILSPTPDPNRSLYQENGDVFARTAIIGSIRKAGTKNSANNPIANDG
jgi:hypothetical protein